MDNTYAFLAGYIYSQNALVAYKDRKGQARVELKLKGDQQLVAYLQKQFGLGAVGEGTWTVKDPEKLVWLLERLYYYIKEPSFKTVFETYLYLARNQKTIQDKQQEIIKLSRDNLALLYSDT